MTHATPELAARTRSDEREPSSGQPASDDARLVGAVPVSVGVSTELTGPAPRVGIGALNRSGGTVHLPQQHPLQPASISVIRRRKNKGQGADNNDQKKSGDARKDDDKKGGDTPKKSGDARKDDEKKPTGGPPTGEPKAEKKIEAEKTPADSPAEQKAEVDRPASEVKGDGDRPGSEPKGGPSTESATSADAKVSTAVGGFEQLTAGEMTARLAGDAKPGSVVTIPLSALPPSMQAFIRRVQSLLGEVDVINLDDLPAVVRLRNKIKTGARSWHQDGKGRIPSSGGAKVLESNRARFFIDFLRSADKPLPTKQMKKGLDGIDRPLREYTAMGWKEAEQSGRLIYDPLADIFYLTCQHYKENDVYFLIDAPRAAIAMSSSVTHQPVSPEDFELLMFRAWEEVAAELQAMNDVMDRARKKKAEEAQRAPESAKDQKTPPPKGQKASPTTAQKVPQGRGQKGPTAKDTKAEPSAEEIAIEKEREAAKATWLKLGADAQTCVVQLDLVRRAYVVARDQAKAAAAHKLEAQRKAAELQEKMAKFNQPKKGGDKKVAEKKGAEKKGVEKKASGGRKDTAKGSQGSLPGADVEGTFSSGDREWARFTWLDGTFLVDNVDAYIGYFNQGKPQVDPYPEGATIGDLAELFRRCLKSTSVTADKTSAIMLAGLVAEPIRHPTATLEALFAVTQFSPFPSSEQAYKGTALPMTTGGTIGSGGVPTEVMYAEGKSAKATIDKVLEGSANPGQTLYQQLGHLPPADILKELISLIFLALGDPLKRMKAVQARDKSMPTPSEPEDAKPHLPTESTTAPVQLETKKAAVDSDTPPDRTMAPTSIIVAVDQPTSNPTAVPTTGGPVAQNSDPLISVKSQKLGTAEVKDGPSQPLAVNPQVLVESFGAKKGDSKVSGGQKSGSVGTSDKKPAKHVVVEYGPREDSGGNPYPVTGLPWKASPVVLHLSELNSLLNEALDLLADDPVWAKQKLAELLDHVSWQIAAMENDPSERASFASGGGVNANYPNTPGSNPDAFECWVFYRHLHDLARANR